MYRQAICMDTYKITDKYEILPFRTHSIVDKSNPVIVGIKDKILKTQQSKNISFFLALKEVLPEILNKFDKVYFTVDINGREAVVIDVKNGIEDLSSFFVYQICGSSGGETIQHTPNFGIMFDGKKIEIVDGTIYLKNSWKYWYNDNVNIQEKNKKEVQ